MDTQCAGMDTRELARPECASGHKTEKHEPATAVLGR
jgi:hypothetical protein